MSTNWWKDWKEGDGRTWVVHVRYEISRLSQWKQKHPRWHHGIKSIPHLNPTRQTSKVSCKKEEIKQENANGTPKTLILFKKQQKSIKGETKR